MNFQPGSVIYSLNAGVRPENIEVPFYSDRAPTSNDTGSGFFPLGKRWLYIGNSEYVLSSFSSSAGVLSANWIELSGGGISEITIDTPSGNATSSSGILNFTGSGVSISGSGNTVNFSVSSSGLAFSDEATSFTAASNHAYFITAGLTMTMPASPSQGDEIILICDTASPVTIQLPLGQFIRVYGNITSSGGTAVSESQGDTLTLYYRSAASTWMASASSSTWALS